MKSLITLFLLMLGLTAFGVTVSGDIKDSSGNPLEMASVKVLTVDSIFVKGALTDSVGIYRIDVPADGRYLLNVSMLGCTTVMTQIDVNGSTTVATVVLDDSSHNLGEVTVIANNITRVDDHLVVVPDQQSVKHSFTAYELIDNLMLPGLSVNPREGKVKMFGKAVALYINGEPADYNLVRNLRPRDIEKVEYFDVPSGRYAQHDAVINFITKVGRTGGYVVLNASQRIGIGKGAYDAYSQIVFGRDRLHLFGGYGFKSRRNDLESKNEEFDFPSGVVERDNPGIDGRSRENSEYGGVKFSHNSKANLFSVTGLINAARNRAHSSSLTYYSEPYDMVEEAIARSRGTNVSPSLKIWNHKILPGNSFFQINTTAQYSQNKADKFMSGLDPYTQGLSEAVSNTDEDNFELNTMLMYGKTFKNKHSLNLQAYEIYTNSSAHYYGDFPSWQRIWRSEFLFLTEYKANVNKVNIYVRPGLSITHEGLHGGNHASNYNPRLFANLTWTPTQKQQISVKGAVGNGIPPLNYKTAGETVHDLLTMVRGNPLLRETKMYLAGLDYSLQLKKFNVMLNGAWQRGVHASVVDYYFDDITPLGHDMLVATMVNGMFETYSTNVSIGWDIYGFLRLQGEGNYSYDRQGDIRLNDVSGKLSLSAFLGEISAKIYVESCTTTLRSDNALEKSNPTYGMVASWNHDGWTATVWMDNIFNRHKQTSDIDIRDLYLMRSRTFAKRYLGVTIGYTFDFGNKKAVKEGRADIKRSFNSAVVQ